MSPRHLIRYAIAGLLGLAVPAHAQDVQRIAAIVNDEVISGLDLRHRLDLVIRTGNLKDEPRVRDQLKDKVLESLIDEKLQIQAARAKNIEINQRELDNAIRRIEQQNRLPAGGFENYVIERGIDRESLMQQITAQIGWTKLLSRIAKKPLDDEIEETLARLKADVGKPEHLISEIFVPVDTPEQEDKALQAARDFVNQLNNGARFETIARQFSRGATAFRGGQVGWIKPGQSSGPIEAAVSAMAVDTISPPIRASGGYYIVKLHKRRKFLTADPGQTKVSLKQIAYPLPEGAGADRVAQANAAMRDVAATVRDCGAVEAAAQAIDGTESIDLGEITLSQLSKLIRDAVAELPVGRFSAPITTPFGVMIIMVCERQEPKARVPDRKVVANELDRREMVKAAQRTMRDLRRDAVVEYR